MRQLFTHSWPWSWSLHCSRCNGPQPIYMNDGQNAVHQIMHNRWVPRWIFTQMTKNPMSVEQQHERMNNAFDENETRNQITNTFNVIISWISMNAMHFLDGSRASVTSSPFVTPCIAIRIMWIDVSLKHYYKNTIHKSPTYQSKWTKTLYEKFEIIFHIFLLFLFGKCWNAISMPECVYWFVNICPRSMIFDMYEGNATFCNGFVIQLFIIMFFALFRILQDVHLYHPLFAF